MFCLVSKILLHISYHILFDSHVFIIVLMTLGYNYSILKSDDLVICMVLKTIIEYLLIK